MVLETIIVVTNVIIVLSNFSIIGYLAHNNLIK